MEVVLFGVSFGYLTPEGFHLRSDVLEGQPNIVMYIPTVDGSPQKFTEVVVA